MREIKFRAWDGEKMLFQYATDDERQMHELEYYFKHPAYELMQYTGLKDKNGVEIYEGDIVQASTSKETVRFGNINGTLGWLPFDIVWPSNWEVIGNIYENKELLDA